MPIKKLFRKYRNLLTPALRDDHFYHSMLGESGARLTETAVRIYMRVVFAGQRRQCSPPPQWSRTLQLPGMVNST